MLIAIASAIGGYVASIYTWPKIKDKVTPYIDWVKAKWG